MKKSKYYNITKDELFVCHLGHGLSISHKGTNDPRTSDFISIAHIDSYRNVTFYKKLEPVMRDYILELAKTSDASVSISQPEIKVFKTKPDINNHHINIIDYD